MIARAIVGLELRPRCTEASVASKQGQPARFQQYVDSSIRINERSISTATCVGSRFTPRCAEPMPSTYDQSKPSGIAMQSFHEGIPLLSTSFRISYHDQIYITLDRRNGSCESMDGNKAGYECRGHRIQCRYIYRLTNGEKFFSKELVRALQGVLGLRGSHKRQREFRRDVTLFKPAP